jgi:hypothetical protein
MVGGMLTHHRMIILKWFLRCGLDLSGSGYSPVTVCCEQGNELSSSIKAETLSGSATISFSWMILPWSTYQTCHPSGVGQIRVHKCDTSKYVSLFRCFIVSLGSKICTYRLDLFY